MIDSDGLVGEAGGPVELAVAGVKDAIRSADELVVTAALPDADAFRMTLGGCLALTSSAAEQIAAGIYKGGEWTFSMSK